MFSSIDKERLDQRRKCCCLVGTINVGQAVDCVYGGGIIASSQNGDAKTSRAMI